jgi:Rrf2 family protein
MYLNPIGFVGLSVCELAPYTFVAGSRRQAIESRDYSDRLHLVSTGLCRVLDTFRVGRAAPSLSESIEQGATNGSLSSGRANRFRVVKAFRATNAYLCLMISRKGKYAIRAALYLAERYGKEPIAVAEIASAEQISRKFLETILLELRYAGILESRRGKGGGYVLSKPPGKITIGSIIRATDGPLSPVDCVSQSAYRPCQDCPDEQTCRIRLVMREVREAISKVLDRKTLAQLVEDGKVAHPADWFMVGI